MNLGRSFVQKAGRCLLMPAEKKHTLSESSAATPNTASIRLHLASAVKEGFSLSHFDTEQVFLRSDIDTETYFRLPPGYVVLSKKVVKLYEAIYGLKHASQQWSLLSSSELESSRFEQSSVLLLCFQNDRERQYR